MKTLDFTRCVRPDGSSYGTAGKCRKGVERPREEQEEQDYEKKMFFSLLNKRYADQPERRARLAEAYSRAETLANKIRDLDDGDTIVVSTHMSVTLKKKISDFDEVSVALKPGPKGKEVSFQVNGELDYGQIEDPRDKVKAVLAVRNMFYTLTRALKPGDILTCSAYEEDGHGDNRKKAYKKIGFFEKGEYLVGVVNEGGGVSPPDFAETKQDVINWYVALFGTRPGRN